MAENAIRWGAGRIARGDWKRHIKRILLQYDIRSVLEFGSGLSTELFSLEPQIERLVSMDILGWHVENMRKVLPEVEFVLYEKGKVPEVEARFDMVFVDGPAGDRSQELKKANEVAVKVIYCHDWGRGQNEVQLDERWVKENVPKMIFLNKWRAQSCW